MASDSEPSLPLPSKRRLRMKALLPSLFSRADLKTILPASTRTGALVIHLEPLGEAARAELHEYDPRGDLVVEGSLDAAVEDIAVAGEVRLGHPGAYDLVAFLGEFHLESQGVLRRASEAGVAGYFDEGVTDSVHDLSFAGIVSRLPPEGQRGRFRV